jgi:iron complex outermembrane receptor protein
MDILQDQFFMHKGKPRVLDAILSSLLLLFSLSAFSQTTGGVIKGKVVDADGRPAVNIHVRLVHSKKATITDNNGYFILQHLPALNDTLLISSVESKVLMHLLTIHNDQTIDLGTIRLLYGINQLQTVEINGRQANSYLSAYSFFGEKTEAKVIDIPQAISTVTRELIQDKMELTLKDAMNDVAGVNQYSGFDEYTIRGFRAENSRDIDGLRGYNMTYTSNMLVNIDRVEVIKGPTATLYGNCDPGGTINLVTKKPLDTSRAEFDIYSGSWNHVRAQGDFTGPLNAAKTLLFRFNAGYDNTHSFVNEFYAKSYEIAPSLTFALNDRLKVNVNFSVANIHTVLDEGQPGYQGDNNLLSTPINLTLNQPGDYLHETDIASVLSGSYRITKNLTFNTGYLNYIAQQNAASHGFNSYITPDSVSLYYLRFNYHTVTSTLTNYFTYKLTTGKVTHLFLAGFDYIKSSAGLDQQYDELPKYGIGNGIVGTFSLKNPQYVQRPVSSYQVSNYDNDEADADENIYHTSGVYVQDQATINKWVLLGSLREEHYLADDGTGLNESVFLPRIGVTYKIQPDLSYYATYNNGFDAFEAATTAQIFNAPLKPNTSHLLETGLKGAFFNDRFSASVAVYQLRLQNVAVNANDPSNPNLFVQQGENRSRGIEAEATGTILPNLSVNLSYAYCIAIVTQSEVPSQIGARVENAPRNESGSWIKYTFKHGLLRGFGISAGHSQVGERATLDPNITLPGYLIINGGVHYTFKHYRFAFNVYNITNQTYWMGAYNNVDKWPGQPRNGMISLGYIF